MTPVERRVWHLAVATFFLFTAFETLQGLETSVNGDTGAVALVLVYTSLAVTALLVASPIVKYTGAKAALFGSSLFYTCFILAHLGGSAALMAGSVTIGCAAGVFWTAQGTYLATCSGGDGVLMGRLTAIFLSVFNLSFVIGPATSAMLLGTGSSIDVLLCGLGATSLMGVAGFGLLQAPSTVPPEISNEMQPPGSEITQPVVEADSPGDGFGAVHVLGSPVLLLLLPLILYNGLVFGVVAGQLPLLLDNVSFRPLVTVMNGVGRVCSCMLFGWFQGQLPRRAFVVSATGCSLTAIMCIGCVLGGTNRGSTPLTLAAAGFFGLGIGCTDATLLAVLGTLFYRNPEAAFAANECVGTLAMAVGFGCTSLVQRLDVQMAVMAVWAIVALVCFFILDYFVCSVDSSPSVRDGDVRDVELVVVIKSVDACYAEVEQQELTHSEVL